MQRIKLVRDELDSGVVRIYAPGYNHKLHLVATVSTNFLFLLVGQVVTEELLDGNGVLWVCLESTCAKETVSGKERN